MNVLGLICWWLVVLKAVLSYDRVFIIRGYPGRSNNSLNPSNTKSPKRNCPKRKNRLSFRYVGRRDNSP